MQTNENATVLVVGASGSFGGAVARALTQRGFRVRATVRPGGRPVALEHVETVQADATDEADLLRASQGAEVIVWGLNLPFPRWEAELLPAARVLCRVAEARGATMVLPGNVYGLGPDFTRPLDEAAPRETPSQKGRLRNQLEAMLHDATRRGARLLIVRAGDYFGPGAEGTSWMEIVTGWAKRGGPLLRPTESPDVLHAWAYLPDVADATARLIERRDELDASEVFHFEGHVLDERTLLAEARRQLAAARRPALRFPWWLLAVLAPFVPMARELQDIRYLWQQPVRLSGGKLRRTLGHVRHTPLPEALARTLQIQAEPGARPQTPVEV